MPPIRRGPYKRYLTDPTASMSKTTAWRRKQLAKHLGGDHENEQPQQVEEAPVAQQVEEVVADQDIPRNDQLLPNSPIDSDTESNHSLRMRQASLHSSRESVIAMDRSPIRRSDSEDSSGFEPLAAMGMRFVDSSSEEENLSDAENPDGNESSEESDSTSSASNASDSSDNEEWDGYLNIEGTNDVAPPLVPVPQQDNDDNNAGNQWLYEGSRLTKNESDVLIMSYIIRWGLEEKSIEHLLQLINCHLPVPVLGSQHLFLKKFPIPDQVKYIYTCPQCFEILPDVVENNEVECEKCNQTSNQTHLKADGSYFVQLSVASQIKNILQNRSLFPLLRKECEEHDVITGSRYKGMRRVGIIRENDVTLQWNTDSVSPYKSAKMQVWPLLACVQELPYHARRENMILCGLYFGKSKPNINSFLKPFVEEFEALHNIGIQVTFPGQNLETTVKVHTFLSSVDSVARPVLQGIMKFNAKFGCSFCLKRGVEIVRGRRRARVYTGCVGPARTTEQHYQALDELYNFNRVNRVKKAHIQGVKDYSVLLDLSNFDIIASFVPDYLHSVLEGVVKTFMKHWTDDAFKECAWYLTNRKRKLLSEKMLAILPPVEITRKPRGLSELNLLKASEFRNFLLYYSVTCLKGLLPRRYLKHWYLLVYSMSVYLKEKCTVDELSRAKLAINKFVESISVIYPNCFHLYTFNVHLLLHIPKAVQHFGGLWASSTFPYEHFNGMIARLISGTRSRPEQVCRAFLRLRCISHLGSDLFRHPNSEEGKSLFKALIMSKYHSSHHSENFAGLPRLFGSPEQYKMSLVERVAVHRCVRGAIDPFARSFKRLIFKGVVYHAGFYETLKERDNSTVILSDEQIISITRILLVKRVMDNVEVCVVLGEIFRNLDENLTQDVELNLNSKDVVQVCHKTNRIMCRKILDLHRKCVRVPYGNAFGIIPLVNSLERD